MIDAIRELFEERGRNPGADIDGGWLQDWGLRHGFLIQVEVTEPCGERCWCEEWDDFPQTCIRLAPQLEAP